MASSPSEGIGKKFAELVVGCGASVVLTARREHALTEIVDVSAAGSLSLPT